MNSKSRFLSVISCLILALFLILPSLTHAASMSDYCLIPPYVKRDVSVNIMFIMDNSDDMNGQAYTSAYSSTTTYLGYFDPEGCYKYDSSGHNNRWYRTNPATNFTCSGTEEFSGNVLNWATMSKIEVLKRVLVGGNLQPQVSYSPNYIAAEGGGWFATYGGCTYTVSTASKLTTSGTCAKALTNATLNVDINYTAPGGKPYEAVSGLLQNINDTNQDLNPDTNSPRTGLIDFGANDTPRTNQCLPFQNTLQAFLNSIAQGSTVTSSPLANAEKLAIDYYINPANGTGCTTKDPFLTCASWESSCTGAMPCRKSFILIVSTGSNVTNTAAYPPYTPSPLCDTDTAFPNTKTQPLVKDACYAATTDLRNDASLEPSNQYVYTYVVQTFGSNANQNILKATALAGQGNYYSAGETNLEDVLKQALQDILKRASSGTAASVLASGQGEGANLIQAVFYPRKKFYNSSTGVYDEISWTGRLSNFWYYIDPFYTSSAILENTTADTIPTLNLSNDCKVTFRYDSSQEITVGDLSGTCTSTGTTVPFESLKTLWESGGLLHARTWSDRTIYVNNGTSMGTLPDTISSGDTLISLMQATNANEATAIAQYVKGNDVKVCSTNKNICSTASDCTAAGETCDSYRSRTVMYNSTTNTWKLGDVLNSTPRISSWVQLNSYDSIYSDTTYTDFLNSSSYTSRGMVFAGANDGMLHAFYLGNLGLPNSGHTAGCTFDSTGNEKACLNGSNLGKEMWAFIPKNVLPYLKYMTDTDYCHIYSVDLSPYIFDASIGTTGCTETNYWDCLKTGVTNPTDRWRTILIGGMRFGGACKYSTSSCAGGGTDCVKSPVSNNGISSYFALDVTDQNNPTLLWEFSDESLGYATTGPAVVRIGTDRTKNGKWFVVFGSGPTGPISTSDQQFLGRSDQNLKIFVRNLKDGSDAGTPTGMPTIANAFAGSMINVTHDADLDYQDDVVYIPYVRKDATAGTWTQGGVLRLSTKENTNPAQWAVSKVMDAVSTVPIGPVTSSVVKLQNTRKGQLWLYFGTGRYYFEQSATVDDADGLRKLYGVLEPCYSTTGFQSDYTLCPNSGVISGNLTDVTSNASADPTTVAGTGGWYITLDASGNYTYSPDTTARSYRAERVITDPLATTTGLVFFTTYKPYNDVCALGGKSFIWAMKYNTGGAPGAALKGMAIMQVSTGSIEQKDLSSAFSDTSATGGYGRRSAAMEGVPPVQQGLSILTTPPPVKRTIHIRER